jgi:hypothetical protein
MSTHSHLNARDNALLETDKAGGKRSVRSWAGGADNKRHGNMKRTILSRLSNSITATMAFPAADAPVDMSKRRGSVESSVAPVGSAPSIAVN